jgi:hypothetical protein
MAPANKAHPVDRPSRPPDAIVFLDEGGDHVGGRHAVSEAFARSVVRLAGFPGILAIVQSSSVTLDLYVEGVQDGLPPGDPALGAEGGDPLQHRA